MGIIKNTFKMGDEGINDQVIAMDMLAAAKASATGYLASTLEAATPEVKRIYSEYLTQDLMGHQALTELCVKKGWYRPYDQADTQLAHLYSSSKEIVRPEAH